MSRTPFGRDDDSAETWDWGQVVTPDGEVIPPGACEGMHNKDEQRELLR